MIYSHIHHPLCRLPVIVNDVGHRPDMRYLSVSRVPTGGVNQGVGLPPNYMFQLVLLIYINTSRRRRRPSRPGIRRPSTRTTRYPPGRRWPRCWPGSNAWGPPGWRADGDAGRRFRAQETSPENRACRIGARSPASSPSHSDEVQEIEMAQKRMPPSLSWDRHPALCRVGGRR